MRADLLALSAEALTVLANAGLVKRAQRELAAGQLPEVEEIPDGTVVGTFREAGGALVTTRLAPGGSLKEGRCSCGAPGVCRHRVALVLAYQLTASAASPPGPGGEPPAGEPAAVWSPGEIGDETLRALLGARLFAEAEAARRRGLVVKIARPHGAQPIPLASLPTCTVRFLVPHAPAFARCDCELGTGCAHLALAVWAFREADLRRPEVAETQVELRAAEAGGAPLPNSATGLPAGAVAAALARDLLLEGPARFGEGSEARFAGARADWADAVWMADLLAGLEQEIERHRRRSSLYRPAHLADALAGLAARQRAIGGELPALYLLGRGQKTETRLDRVRLIALGARLEADGRDRRAQVYLADPDSAGILLCEKTYSFGEEETIPEGAELGRRRIAGALSLEALASGQLLTHVAKRRANHELVFGQMTATTSSWLPQKGDWQDLPAPLRIDSLRQLEELAGTRPPRLLRPRLRTEAMHVFPLGELGEPLYDPARQELSCWASLPGDGGRLRIALVHRSCAPAALDALAATLSGRFGTPRFLAGEVRKQAGHYEVEPTAIAADRVIVPDLEAPGEKQKIRLGREIETPDPLEEATMAAGSLLDEAAHQGLRHLPPGFAARLESSAQDLEDLGLRTLAARQAHLARALRLAREAPGPEGWNAATEAWTLAILRQRLTAEQL